MYSINSLQNYPNQTCIDGKWVLKRPANYQHRTIFEKLKQSWDVLVGNADAVYWEKQ